VVTQPHMHRPRARPQRHSPTGTAISAYVYTRSTPIICGQQGKAVYCECDSSRSLRLRQAAKSSCIDNLRWVLRLLHRQLCIEIAPSRTSRYSCSTTPVSIEKHKHKHQPHTGQCGHDFVDFSCVTQHRHYPRHKLGTPLRRNTEGLPGATHPDI
jgi:hypothetical protein